MYLKSQFCVHLRLCCSNFCFSSRTRTLCQTFPHRTFHRQPRLHFHIWMKCSFCGEPFRSLLLQLTSFLVLRVQIHHEPVLDVGTRASSRSRRRFCSLCRHQLGLESAVLIKLVLI